MSITREQVADLQPGDVVRVTGWDGLTVEGAVAVSGADGGTLWLGQHVRLTHQTGCEPTWTQRPDATLTVVSRAPRPLYVNHPRTEPFAGDVVRVADRDGSRNTWVHHSDGRWRSTTNGLLVVEGGFEGLSLRLLVDGETGQAVSS